MTETRQQDATTQIVRRLDRVVREVIRPARVRHRSPLSVAARAVGGEPVTFAEGTQGTLSPLAPGASWGRAWDTVWMHVQGQVPDDWDAESTSATELEIDLGFTTAQSGFQAEGLVYTAEGTVVRALSPLNHRIPLDVTPGGKVEYWVEAAANPTLNTAHGTDLIPLAHLGSWESAGEAEIYRFGGAHLAVPDADVVALGHDVDLLRGIATDESTDVRRRDLILAAIERMLAVLDPTEVAGTAAAARRELTGVLSAPAHASAMTLTAVGHAHIDSAWLWPLRETIRKCARTFSNVLTLMEDNPDFVFACSSAQQFAWMKEHYPDLFTRIREAVSRGQFVPVGGMWVESDTNMPSGESLVRQFVAGQGFFMREFGIECPEVWLPDSFGYTGAFPQIARSAGARWFFGQKMSWNRTNRMPHHTFTWEGIDGSRILTHFTPVDTYNSDLSPFELSYAQRNFADHDDFSGSIVPFGYGDGGGGPTREMLEAGRRAADVEGLPRVRFGAPSEFFAQAQAEASETGETGPATWTGEMYLELHRGTYSSQARTKRGNRRAEALLREAELWAATATVRAGAPYPQEQLTRIWERTLLLQFHDILPGSSISWVHTDAERMHAQDAAALERIITGSLDLLAGVGSETITVNGSPFPRSGIAPLAAAPVETVSQDVSVAREADRHVLRSAHLELHVADDGTFVELLDHASGRGLFSSGTPGNALDLHQDIPTDWDAWDIDAHYRELTVPTDGTACVQMADDGAPAVRITRTFGSSRVEQVVTVLADRPVVDIVTTVDWHECQRLLKLAHPFRIDARASAAETQFGYVERPTHENTSWDEARFEVVAHRWVHVSDRVVGAAVVNDSTYGHDITRIPGEEYRTQVRQTLLRGPLYPDPESDQGVHTFRSRMVLTPDVSGAVEEAYDLDTPLRAVTGSGADVAPVAQAFGAGVVLHTVKLAEDGSGDLIIRVYEALGRPTRARIVVDSATIRPVDSLERAVDTDREAAQNQLELDLRAFELVTVRARPH
ncbi:alpha-mannosidase [Ruania halotolerans]|uniref:alpha-mannosidase n=1 Tax=Ruania halotolerans TaxID=2897773 RepID=UPI001E32AE8A|nr:glycoside hydrolase family 38 C-terminal domain-containing protein [Ruania halotolerans]UFU08054.1 glycosyl hydrolase-related protein [Ruania halotolerans]